MVVVLLVWVAWTINLKSEVRTLTLEIRNTNKKQEVEVCLLFLLNKDPVRYLPRRGFFIKAQGTRPKVQGLAILSGLIKYERLVP